MLPQPRPVLRNQLFLHASFWTKAFRGITREILIRILR
jgi:hypothetical protein